MGGLVDQRRGVARAHPQGGSSGRIGRANHAGATGRQDQVNVRVLHELLGQGHRWLINPADDVRRGPGFDRRLQHNPRRLNRAILGPWVGRKDNPVAGLEGNQRLKHRRGGGVGGGHNAREDPHGFGNALDPKGFVFLNDAAGFLVFVLVVDKFGGEVIFDHLVFDHPHPGFHNGHFGQGNPGSVGSEGRLFENRIDLRLAEAGVGALSSLDPCNQGFEFVIVGNGHGAPPKNRRDCF